ncbi:hypothetical protein ABPG77_005198 [Micractinium sp. CCAP 211/92]
MAQSASEVGAGGPQPAAGGLQLGGAAAADSPASSGRWELSTPIGIFSHVPAEVLLSGGPHSWGFLALLGWVLWFALQVPWRALLEPHIAHAPGAAPPRRHPALGVGAGPWLAAVLRTFCYGWASTVLWMTHLEPHREFKSWEDVYFFCGNRYQHCTPDFRWNGSGWQQAFILWNFVLSSALLLQKYVIALGLGGLLPGEEVVTRESFVSIAWRLVPYWMNQWEQQWGAECSSMLFELPHFALELLVVLPCVQILCGRLRVMAQPHIREPLPAGAAHRAAPAAQRLGRAEGAQLAAAAAGAAQRGAGGPAGADADADAGAGADRAECWVPDVMRCRWRRDPAQRALLPRLRANLRAMAMLALILAVAATNSLLVPLALERRPALSQRADQILRFKQELAFVVNTGRHADTALWYQRVAAAAAASHDGVDAGGKTPWAANSSGAGDSAGSRSSDSGGAAAGKAAHEPSSGGDEGGSQGAAGFLAAALEGSTNSSRLDAKLAVWSTLWRPLLPAHWLRAVMAADAGQVAGLDPAYLSALQYEEHPQSAALAAQLHAAANNPAASAAAAKALQQLLQHPEQAGSILPAAGSEAERVQGRDKSMVHLLLMASMAAGIDAKAAPLQLRASAVLAAKPSPGAAEAGGEAALAAVRRDLEWLRRQQALYAAKLTPTAADAGSAGGASRSSNASSGSRWAGFGRASSSWQQQQRMAPLYRLLHKHCAELERMRSPDHHRLIPLVEASLAIMRLSCERFFSLLAVFLGFLLFRDPPPAAQRAIRVVAAFAAVFQRMVLYSFPAICWAYGAGALFSSFVSVVFWTGPLVRAVERVRNAATTVQPRHWHSATPAEVERMGGQCAICWGDMPLAGTAAASVAAPAAGVAAAAAGAADADAAAVPASGQPGGGPGNQGGSSSGGGPGGAAMSLPCGHAFHRECLQQWLQQCYGQARAATCPMCQASIPLRVRYRMPWHQQASPQARPEEVAGPGAGVAAEGIPGLAALALALQASCEDFRARFEPMLDLGAQPEAPAPGALPADGAQWPQAEDILLPPQQQPQPQLPAQQPQPAAAPLQAHPLADAGQQEAVGEAQQAQQQDGQQALPQNVVQPQPELIAPGAAAVAAQHEQQAARRRGLLVRLLNRRRG